MKDKIIFLGTGDSKPTKKRNHTAVYLSLGFAKILIDCGEGTQRQFKIAKINPGKLTHLLITHWHGDHTLGLTGLFETLAMNEYKKTLKVFGPKGTKKNIQLLEKIYGKFKIKLEIKEISSQKIDQGEFMIESKPMSHGIPTNAYSIIIKDKLRLDKSKLKKLNLPHSPILSKLKEGKDIKINGKAIKASSVSYSQKGKKITFVIDTSLNPKIIDLAKNSDILVAEATFLDKDANYAKSHKHLTAKQVGGIAKKAKVKSLIITHISQRYEKDLESVLKETKKVFKNTTLVKDLDELGF